MRCVQASHVAKAFDLAAFIPETNIAHGGVFCVGMPRCELLLGRTKGRYGLSGRFNFGSQIRYHLIPHDKFLGFASNCHW